MKQDQSRAEYQRERWRKDRFAPGFAVVTLVGLVSNEPHVRIDLGGFRRTFFEIIIKEIAEEHPKGRKNKSPRVSRSKFVVKCEGDLADFAINSLSPGDFIMVHGRVSGGLDSVSITLVVPDEILPIRYAHGSSGKHVSIRKERLAHLMDCAKRGGWDPSGPFGFPDHETEE